MGYYPYICVQIYVSMKVKRQSKADERHELIMIEYDNLIKELGEEARHRKKRYLYDEVADRVHYSSDHVRKVINRILSNRPAER